MVNSVYTCRRIFLSFSFAPLANFLSAFTQHLLPLPLRVSCEWSGPNFFLFFFFFAFHRFSLPKKGTCYHFIDDICVRVCAEAGLKDSFFFLRLNFWVLAHDCDQDERKCDQKNGTRARPEKFCDWHRKDFSSPAYHFIELPTTPHHFVFSNFAAICLTIVCVPVFCLFVCLFYYGNPTGRGLITGNPSKP